MFLTVNLAQDQSRISRYISNTLLTEVENTLKKWEKVLLYLNKRGSYNSLICEDCQYLWECKNCDISLSVHNTPKKLLCHLCGNSENYPISCKNCQGTKLLSVWVGTQQIEEVLKNYFWERTSVYRFDSDSMKTLTSKKEALNNMQDTQIIIGTKMLTTGFDFEKIWLIWVILVEQELSYPSYNAEENAYRNLKQFIGRGNRKTQKSSVILQTFIPAHSLVQSITEESFKAFFSRTLKERKQFWYPPFNDLVKLEYRHKEAKKTLIFLETLEKDLQAKNIWEKIQILRSTSTFKKNNTYHGQLILKWPELRKFLKPLHSLILKTPNLSVIFS